LQGFYISIKKDTAGKEESLCTVNRVKGIIAVNFIELMEFFEICSSYFTKDQNIEDGLLPKYI
jgi:hypothetical protein